MYKQFFKALSLLAICLTIISFIVSCSRPHTHTEEIIERIEPTCTQNGYTEGKKCSVCQETLVEPQTILGGHTEEIIEKIEPTCTQNGYTEGKKCSVCQETLVEPQTILGGHTEEIIERIEPDVEKTGYTEGSKCSVCDEILIVPCEISLLSIEIDGEKSTKGQIFGSLIFNSLGGNFSVYYANSQKERLSYFNELSTFAPTTDNYSLELDSLIIPSGCEYIIATNESEYVYFAKLPNEYLLGDKNYTYSSLSDVHLNGGAEGDGKYFNGALDFLDKYGEIDFVAISGDISDGDEDDMDYFNETIENRSYKVYTTSGNHDTPAVKSGLWLEKMNTSMKMDDEVLDIAPNILDFVFIPKESQDSVFVFLCQTSWSYPKRPTGTEYSLVTEEQLSWLADMLEKYKDKHVLLYFHTFLASPNGTQNDTVGNLVAPNDYSYDLPYSFGTADEVSFRALLKEYKNVIYFSGHSHWMFELEVYNPNLNVSNFDGEYCYMVHNSSVCSPRYVSETKYPKRIEKEGINSEGWIVEIYDSALILIPVDFLSETFYTEYMKIIPLN